MSDSGLTRVEPHALEHGAVLPQCLDNQYVPPHLYDVLSRSGKSFESDDVARARAQSMKAEFMRALVYSPQVVVNRAFLHNNHILREEFEHAVSRTAGRSREAFKALLEARAIVPYYSDVAADQRPQYGTTERAAESVAELLRESNSAYVTLDPARVASLARAFTDYVQALETISADDASAMLRDLRGGDPVFAAEGGRFREELKRLSAFAIERERERGRFGRNDIYEAYFIEAESNVATGNYSFRGDYDRELKALVDLRYNTTLPDELDRYALTPRNLPTRTALRDASATSASASTGLPHLHTFAAVDHRILSQAYSELDLTSIDGLTLEDVRAIRDLDVWRAFRDAQNKLLLRDHPTEHAILERFEHFKDAQTAFMDRLTRWAIANDREHITEPCLVGLRWVLNLSGYAIRLLPDGEDASEFIETAEHVGLLEALPETVLLPAINLVIDAFDVKARRRRIDHCRQLQVIADRRAYDRDEIRTILTDVRGGSQSTGVATLRTANPGAGQSIRP